LGGSRQPLIDEAINDHLRVLYAQHPIEIESGGIHQVKPWFAGKLDFAPVLDFSGDEEFPLQGGAIALFVDRKAATFVFKHRLHTASLFVFRSQDLSFPGGTESAIGSRSATSAASRGYNVLLWRDHDLGYALVSDMAPGTLARLAEKLAQTTAR
jgi:anti-sigma factor RsiW